MNDAQSQPVKPSRHYSRAHPAFCRVIFRSFVSKPISGLHRDQKAVRTPRKFGASRCSRYGRSDFGGSGIRSDRFGALPRNSLPRQHASHFSASRPAHSIRHNHQSNFRHHSKTIFVPLAHAPNVRLRPNLDHAARVTLPRARAGPKFLFNFRPGSHGSYARSRLCSQTMPGTQVKSEIVNNIGRTCRKVHVAEIGLPPGPRLNTHFVVWLPRPEYVPL